MMLQGLAIMIINAITPNRCTSSILMVASHQRTGKRILDHLHKKGIRQPSTRGPLNTVREAMRQAEACTHSGLHIACSMAVKATTAQKIVPYSKKRWSKTPNSLRNNHHLEKSTIPCSGLLTTVNTLHLTLCFFRNNPTKIAKPNL
jgi:hypothetical protein